MAAGNAKGLVQVFDANSRTTLRHFRGHEGAVQCVRFSALDLQTLFSAGDDGTLRMWDIAEGRETMKVESAHADYIRALAVHPSSPDLLFTGSYDHTVKMWDTRTATSAQMSLHHGNPVESVLVFPGGGLVATAGGPVVKLWDVLAGGRLAATLGNHQKTVTGLVVDGDGSRLLSCSLDASVKVYDLSTHEVTSSLKYTAPLLSLAVSPLNAHVAVGTADSMLAVRSRSAASSASAAAAAAAAATAAEESGALPALPTLGSTGPKRLNAGNYRYFLRGKSEGASADDARVEARRRAKLKDYDAFLRRFQYGAALDAAVKTTRPAVVVSMLEELIQRDALILALSNRNEASLEPLVAFLLKYITNPRYASLLVDVANVTVDLYAPVLGQSMVIDELFVKLRNKLKDELTFQKSLLSVAGMLELLFAGAK